MNLARNLLHWSCYCIVCQRSYSIKSERDRNWLTENQTLLLWLSTRGTNKHCTCGHSCLVQDLQSSYCSNWSRIKFWNTSPYLASFGYFFVYYKRWYLRYQLYDLKYRGEEGHQQINEQDEFLYDGFVIYSNEDRQWVHGTLREELEHNRNFKLFIYMRHMLGGGVIADRILEEVMQRRK